MIRSFQGLLCGCLIIEFIGRQIFWVWLDKMGFTHRESHGRSFFSLYCWR